MSNCIVQRLRKLEKKLDALFTKSIRIDSWTVSKLARNMTLTTPAARA